MPPWFLAAVTLAAAALAQTPEVPAPAAPAPADPAAEPTPADGAESGEEEELPPLLVEPALVEYIQAAYPPEALEAGVEGTVGLLIEIDETGAVSAVEVLAPAGHGFDEAAVEAAGRFMFSPAEDETGPVPVAIEFRYGFVLDAAQTEGAVPVEADEPPPAPVNLEGTLVEMGTRAPVEGAAVRATASDGATLETTTDDAGRWAFSGVADGAVALTAVHPDYITAERSVDVVTGQVTDLRFWIRNRDYRDDAAVFVYQRKSDDVARRTITVDEIRRIPGTFGDPVRVIQNLPGAARSPLGSGLLVIRGSNPEDSGVYVDGIRIPLIYHLGGYVSVVNADLVESVDYLPGSYGVEYGRSMGGVVDLTTKREFPERGRITWSTDLLDSGGLFAGRVGKKKKIGVAAAARRSYIDAVILSMPEEVVDPDFVVKPRWYDYQLKIAPAEPGPDDLSLLVFGFEDQLLVSTPSGFAQGTDADTQGDLGTSYSTHRLSLMWSRALSDTTTVRVNPAFGTDAVHFTLGNDFTIDQWQFLVEIRGELLWTPSEAIELTAGVDLIGGGYTFTTELPFNPGTLGDYDPLAEREPWTVEGAGQAWGPDPYLSLNWRPLADRDRLLLRPGVRVSYITVKEGDRPEGDKLLYQDWAIDPRLSGRYALTESGGPKFGVGVYTQPPQPFEMWRPEGRAELDFERALSAELGWTQQIGDAINADGAVFAKKLDRLVVTNPEFEDLDSAFYTNTGVGRIFGLEFIVRHLPVDRFFGWVSYTLSRSERNDDPDDPDQFWYPYEYDQTHILVATAGYRLPRSWEISAKFQNVTGNPYTPYSGGVADIDQDLYTPYSTGDYNSERLPPYLAGHMRIDKIIAFKRVKLDLYLDMLNVVTGENPEFVIYNYDYTESDYLSGLPFIPSPGFQIEVDL